MLSPAVSCPLCKKETSQIWKKNDFTLFQFPIAKPFPSIPTQDLNVYYCPNCVHAFIWPRPSEDMIDQFYKVGYDYYTSPLQSGGLTTQIVEEPLKFIRQEIKKHFGDKKVSMVDIGGNDGYSLYQMKDICQRQLLVEPNKTAGEIAAGVGIEVYPDFLTIRTAQKFAQKFDVVITRHVIEHIDDPEDFIKALATIVKPEGLIFVETPDLLSLLKNNLVRILSLQHFHYFSPYSLAEAAGKSAHLVHSKTVQGYASINVFSPGQGKHVLPKAQRHTYDTLAFSLAKRFEDHCQQLRMQIEEWYQQGKKIWIWGAGSAANEVQRVYDLPAHFFTGIIDSDPKKVHLYLPFLPSLRISSTAKAYKKGVGCILVTTFSVKEVAERVHKEKPTIQVTDLYGLSQN